MGAHWRERTLYRRHIGRRMRNWVLSLIHGKASILPTLGLTKFHAGKAAFILQEIWARLISYNFSSAVMDCVELPVRKTKYLYKISVSAAVLVCRKFIFSLITGLVFRCDCLPFPRARSRSRKALLPSIIYGSL